MIGDCHVGWRFAYPTYKNLSPVGRHRREALFADKEKYTKADRLRPSTAAIQKKK